MTQVLKSVTNAAGFTEEYTSEINGNSTLELIIIDGIVTGGDECILFGINLLHDDNDGGDLDGINNAVRTKDGRIKSRVLFTQQTLRVLIQIIDEFDIPIGDEADMRSFLEEAERNQLS